MFLKRVITLLRAGGGCYGRRGAAIHALLCATASRARGRVHAIKMATLSTGHVSAPLSPSKVTHMLLVNSMAAQGRGEPSLAGFSHFGVRSKCTCELDRTTVVVASRCLRPAPCKAAPSTAPSKGRLCGFTLLGRHPCAWGHARTGWRAQRGLWLPAPRQLARSSARTRSCTLAQPCMESARCSCTEWAAFDTGRAQCNLDCCITFSRLPLGLYYNQRSGHRHPDLGARCRHGRGG